MSSIYLPNSFEERGVTIPFTTPTVRSARLRGDRPSKREFLLPGLSGGDGTYVIPFDALPELIELNMYDRALLEHLNGAESVTPLDLRQMVLKVDSEGFGGLERTTAAKQELAYAENVGLFNQCLLIIRALKLLSDDAQELDLKVLITPEGQRLAKQQFAGYAAKAGTTSDDVMKKLEYWANLIGLIGVRDADHPGHLMREQTRLLAMTEDLREYIKKEPPEAQFMGKGVISAAELASGIVNDELQAAWSFEDNIAQSLENAEATMNSVRGHLDTISWVLDGWERMIDDWNDSSDSFRNARRKVLEMIYENMPILPKDILGRDQLDEAITIREKQTGWVKANVDWRTEEMDGEMLARLGQYQKIAA